MRICLFALFLLFSGGLSAQPQTDDLLQKLLSNNKNSFFQNIISHPQKYRLQIIYTQIDRDKNNKPSFTNYCYHVDSSLYWYPASMVKLPLAALSLEKLNELNVKGVNKFTTVKFDSAYPEQVQEWRDSTSQSGFPSLAQFIRKAFLISDNDAYNRMYQFVGQREINEKMHEKGYNNTRIVRQFMGFTEEENRHTNPLHFTDSTGHVLYAQPMAYNSDSFSFPNSPVTHYNRNDSLVKEPMDFSRQNTLPLLSLQQMLQSIMFPASVPAKQRFHLSEEDYAFLRQYLSQYPSETPYPKYDTAQYYDSYVKFFFTDSNHQAMPPGIRVFNKVGWSYGFLTDVSYVADFKHKTEYMLTATVYVNENEILNDNQYEYKTVGHPFLYGLGQTIYQYEWHRKRRRKPDLSEFEIKYEHRDPNDRRPSLKDADN